jgi:hypothetical protein
MSSRYTKNPNSIRQRVEDLLLEHKGLTLADILEEITDHTKGGVSKIICDLRDAGTIYVKDWVLDHPGQKRHPRPLWDHAQNSKRQPPQNKMRPMPVSDAARLKQRRRDKAVAHGAQSRYMFKLVKRAQS